MKMKKTKSIPYYGGKARIASWICQHMPKHTVYVEPFVGGGSVFMKKPKPSVSNNNYYREVLNDINGLLINMYKVLQNKDSRKEFLEILKYTPYSLQLYKEHKEKLKGNSHLNKDLDLNLAVSYYYNLCTSFANAEHAGFGRGVFGRNLSLTWMNRKKSLELILQRLDSVTIENLDAIDVIKTWDSPQTLFYCDPPYVGTDQGHYTGYTLEDFDNLTNTLDNIQGSFLLSHYETHETKVPDNWERFYKNTTCSAKGRVGYDRSKKQDESDQNRQRTEVLYRKLASIEPREEILKLYTSGNFDCFPAPGWIGEKPCSKQVVFDF